MKVLRFHCLFLFPNCIQCSGLDSCLKEAVTYLITCLYLTLFTPWKMNVTSISRTLTYIWAERILFYYHHHTFIEKIMTELETVQLLPNKNRGQYLSHGSTGWCNDYQRSPVCKMFFLIFVPISKKSSSLPPRIHTQLQNFFLCMQWSLKTTKSFFFGHLHNIPLPVFPAE